MATTTGAVADFIGGGGSDKGNLYMGGSRSVFPARKNKTTRAAMIDMPADNKFKEVKLEDARSGHTIQIIEVYDLYAGIGAGDIGIIEGFDGSGAIHVKWKNGKNIPAMPGVDKFKIFESRK